MLIKIDFLCRDRISAAPIIPDLILLLDLAARAEFKRIQEWVSFYFNSPLHAPNLYPKHDLFFQLMKLRFIAEKDQIPILGLILPGRLAFKL